MVNRGCSRDHASDGAQFFASGREPVLPARVAPHPLYMSGYTEGAIFDLGAIGTSAGFVAKPFTPDRLLRRARQVLDAGA